MRSTTEEIATLTYSSGNIQTILLIGLYSERRGVEEAEEDDDNLYEEEDHQPHESEGEGDDLEDNMEK